MLENSYLTHFCACIIGFCMMMGACAQAAGDKMQEYSNMSSVMPDDQLMTIKVEGETYMRLKDKDLHEVLPHKSIPIGVHISEVFLENGKYHLVGGRLPVVEGIYKISNNTLCIKSFQANEFRCRALFKNTQGEYIAVNLPVSGLKTTPFKISIQPLNE